MRAPLLLQLCLIPLFLECISAIVVRDTSSNETTTSTSISTESVDINPTERVQFQTTVTGFDDTRTTTREERLGENTDVASIIHSAIGKASKPKAVVQSTTDGWGSDTLSLPQTTNPSEAFPKVITNNGQTLTAAPATRVVIGSQTLGEGTATLGQGDGATKVHLDGNGVPVIIVGDQTSTAQPVLATTVIQGQTLTPGGPAVTVNSGSQATTFSINSAGETLAIAEGATSTLPAPPTQIFSIGDITATAAVLGLQFLIGSSTLAIGQPVTVSGTIMSLTTDAAGSTVLVAGASSTTLAPMSHVTGALQDLDITTTVIDGTTQYIVGTETLAPGHPVTVDGIPISIATSGSTTVLVVGDMTTTIVPGLTDFIANTAAATPGSGNDATVTSKKADAAKMEGWRVGVAYAWTLGITLFGLG